MKITVNSDELTGVPEFEGTVDGPVEITAKCENGDRAWLLSITLGEWNGIPRIVSAETHDYQPC